MAENATTEEVIDFVVNSDTLFGDLRDAILDRLKHMPKPWTVMTESEQRDMIYGVEQVARHLVHEAVQIIAASGRPAIEARLEQCAVKDDIKIVIRANRHHGLREQLLDSVGKPVLIVVADEEAYMGERAPAKPEPDQQSLAIAAEVLANSGDDGDTVKPFRGKPKK